jgi:xanthine dehydrogenase YagR molybdenum-binding subunit
VVKVNQIVAVQDGGLILNPLTARSQVNGGIIMGIGYALYEERVMDGTSGVVLNPNFETYKLPGIADIPAIDVILLQMPERGVIGIGEPVHIPTAAAIANAVANAIGVRVYEIPITPDRVLSALGQTGEDAYQRRQQAIRRAFERFAEIATRPTPAAINPFTRLV